MAHGDVLRAPRAPCLLCVACAVLKGWIRGAKAYGMPCRGARPPVCTVVACVRV